MKLIQLFLLLSTTLMLKAQDKDFSLQLVNGSRKIYKWNEGQHLNLRTAQGTQYKGLLSISSESEIVIGNQSILIDSVKRIASFRWYQPIILMAGAASMYFIDPVFGITPFFWYATTFPNCKTADGSRHFLIVPKGKNPSSVQEPDRDFLWLYKGDSMFYQKDQLRLYSFAKKNEHIKRSWRSNSNIYITTQDSLCLRGNLNFKGRDTITIGLIPVKTSTITSISGSYFNPATDSLTIAPANRSLAYHSIKTKKHMRLIVNPPGNFMRLGVDFPKLYVLKPTLVFDYYNSKHWGFTITPGWRFKYGPLPFPLSIVDRFDCYCKTAQIRVSPFYWFTRPDNKAFHVGPTFGFRYTYGDSVRTFSEGYGDDYYLLWYKRNFYDAGICIGNIQPGKAGLGYSCIIGGSYAETTFRTDHVYRSPTGTEKTFNYWLDFSLIYSFRINKHPSKKQEDSE